MASKTEEDCPSAVLPLTEPGDIVEVRAALGSKGGLDGTLTAGFTTATFPEITGTTGIGVGFAGARSKKLCNDAGSDEGLGKFLFLYIE